MTKKTDKLLGVASFDRTPTSFVKSVRKAT